MTDERMTQGDVRLREELVDVFRAHIPEANHREAYCSCGTPIGDYATGFLAHLSGVVIEWHGRIVAARVGEVVERVEAVLDMWGAGEHDATACRDYDCELCAVVACDADIRAALKATP